MKKYAPIIIPTLNRYKHLKRCVESLAANKLAPMTELVIGLDYPPAEKYVKGYEMIKEYLPTISGFLKVTIMETPQNIGETANSRRLKEYIRQQGYTTYIFLEDDNEVSPNFLEYMDWGLTTFEDDPRINAICGFNEVSVDFLEDNVFMARRYNAWGVGRWDKKWEALRDMVHEPNFFKNKIKEYPIITIFGGDVHRASCVIGAIETGKIHGDGITYLKAKDQQFSVYPKINKVRNYGHDGLGTHGGSKKQSEFYTGISIDESMDFVPSTDTLLEDKRIEKLFKRHFVLPFKIRAYETCNFISYKLFGKGLSKLLVAYKKGKK